MVRFDQSCFKINVGHRIQLVHHDINIIGTYSGGDHRDPLFPDVSGMRYEFPMMATELNTVKMLAHLLDPAGISNCDHRIGHLLRTEVKMINGTTIIYDQLGFLNSMHCYTTGTVFCR